MHHRSSESPAFELTRNHRAILSIQLPNAWGGHTTESACSICYLSGMLCYMPDFLNTCQCQRSMFSDHVSSSVFPDVNLLNGNGRMHGASIQSKPQSLPYPFPYDKTRHLWVWCFCCYIKILALCLSSL